MLLGARERIGGDLSLWVSSCKLAGEMVIAVVDEVVVVVWLFFLVQGAWCCVRGERFACISLELG